MAGNDHTSDQWFELRTVPAVCASGPSSKRLKKSSGQILNMSRPEVSVSPIAFYPTKGQHKQYKDLDWYL
jgi:hypothetical protein